MAKSPRRRDPTFLQIAAFAAFGGFGAIGVSIYATVATWRGGHPNTTFFFFGLWGIAALCGAVANVVVYRQSGEPPPKKPGGGQRAPQLRLLEGRAAAPPVPENERRAA